MLISNSVRKIRRGVPIRVRSSTGRFWVDIKPVIGRADLRVRLRPIGAYTPVGIIDMGLGGREDISDIRAETGGKINLVTPERHWVDPEHTADTAAPK
jgi:hypothetical protein